MNGRHEGTQGRRHEGRGSLPCRLVSLTACLVLLSLTTPAFAELPTYDTRHYRVHTDVERDLARDLCNRLDLMYDEYSRRLVDFGTGDDQRFEVYIFNRQEDYLAFTENRFPNTGGVFISKRAALAAFLSGQGRDGLRRTLQHEAFHQFAFKRIGPGVPIWLNEGLAQVFEEGIFKGNRFLLGQVPPRRIRQLQFDMKNQRLSDFRGFLALSNEAWAQNLSDPERAGTQYTQAWAMTHFLVFATDEKGAYRYRDRLFQMLKLIHAGTSSENAFAQCFGANLDGFQTRFVEYARRLQPTNEASYLEHQDILADMLVELHDRGERFTSIDTFRKFLSDNRFRIEYRKGQIHWKSDADTDVYFRNLDGSALTATDLFIATRAGAPIDDLVCRPQPGLAIRTIFSRGSGRIDRETIVE